MPLEDIPRLDAVSEDINSTMASGPLQNLTMVARSHQIQDLLGQATEDNFTGQLLDVPQHEAFTIGIICALYFETAAILALFDQRYSNTLEKMANDNNIYHLGKIGNHNVVVVDCGKGKVNAAIAATDILRTFTSIKIGFMVGVGGGVPVGNHQKEDIRLGDVVVSNPTKGYGGVLQYDFKRTKAGDKFELHEQGFLNHPPKYLLNAINALRTCEILATYRQRRQYKMMEYLAKIKDATSIKGGDTPYQYQGAENDTLFPSDFIHPDMDKSCANTCAQISDEISRPLLYPSFVHHLPQIHWGTIASGDQVMQDGVKRDKIAKEHNILCFEMEAAGVVNDFPCLVVRGICNYADSHQKKEWQPYAAATAAAFVKYLLVTFIQAEEVKGV